MTTPQRHGYVLAMAVLQSQLWENPEDDLRAAVNHFTHNVSRETMFGPLEYHELAHKAIEYKNTPRQPTYWNPVKIWLDDERVAPGGWLHAHSVGEALSLILMYPVAQLSLDHDLGEQRHVAPGQDDWHVDGSTGKDLLKIIAACCSEANPLSRNLAQCAYDIHSANVVAWAPMEDLIKYILKHRLT